MNILTDNIVKIKFKDINNALLVDFVKNGKSLLSLKDITSEIVELISIEYSFNKHEFKYAIKNKESAKSLFSDTRYPNLKSEHFIIARALKLNVFDVYEKKENLLTSSYKTKLIKFLKHSFCKKHFNSEMLNNISGITDPSLLLQYIPLDTFYRDFNLNSKYYYIHTIRVMIYNILFAPLQPFIEVFDREFIWITECLSTFNIPGFKYADFSTENDVIMKTLRDLWNTKIIETYQKAKNLLLEEKECALKFEDNEAIKEIELINRELDDTIANIDLSNLKTPIQLLKYWPDILAPGPSLLYPH